MKKKQILSMVLVVLMIFGMVPFGLFNNEVKAIDLFDPSKLHWEFPYRCQDDAITFEALKKPIEVEAEKRTLAPIVKPEVMNKIQNGVLFIQMNIYNEQVGNRIIQIPIFKGASISSSSSLTTTLFYGDKVDVKYIIKNDIINASSNKSTEGERQYTVTDTAKVTKRGYYKPKYHSVPESVYDECSLYYFDTDIIVKATQTVKDTNFVNYSVNFNNAQDFMFYATELIGNGMKFSSDYKYSSTTYETVAVGSPSISDPVVNSLPDPIGECVPEPPSTKDIDTSTLIFSFSWLGSHTETKLNTSIASITNTTSKNMTIDAYNGNGDKVFNTQLMPGNTYKIPSNKLGKFSRLVTNGQKLGFVEGQPIKPADPYFPDDAIGKAKAEANAKIDALKNLTKEEKALYKDKVNAATTSAEVNKAYVDAVLADTSKGSVATARAKALETISKLENIKPEDKENAIKAINEAKTIAEVAQALGDAIDKDKTELQAAKDAAKTEINALNNLKPEEKQQFLDRIDAATKVTDIQEIVKEAKIADVKQKDITDAESVIEEDPTIPEDKKQEEKDKLKDYTEEELLAKAKESAKNIINSLPNLSDKDKEALNAKVDEAATTSEVKAVVEEAKALDKAKKNAKDAIDELTNLDDASKDKIKEDITNATDEETINKIVQDAKAEDKKIADAKQEAKDKINDLDNLTPDEKKTLTDKIDGIKGTPEDAQKAIDEIVKEAETKDKKNADAKTLDEAKQTAKDVIDKLDNLTPEEKKDFLDRIDNATSPEEIQTIVEEAKTKDKENLDKAKKEAKDTIDKNQDIDPNKKDAIKEEIDKADTIDDKKKSDGT